MNNRTFACARGLTADAVVGLLREQCDLYVRLESLVMQQREMVGGDEVEPLIGLLADRQRLSERLTEIGRTLAPIRREWHEFRDQLTPDDRSTADALLSEADGRLQRIIASDEQDARILAARRATVARKLRSSAAGQDAAFAYQAPANRSGRLDVVEGSDT